jgi:hypothetical protein
MNSHIRLCAAVFVFAIAFLFFAPVVAAQEQPVRPPSDVKPPDTPTETPTGERDQIKPPSPTPPPTAVTPETYANSSTISWGSLIIGLILGAGIGYLIGRQSGPGDVERRDRAA